jgi:hypothetical protein
VSQGAPLSDAWIDAALRAVEVPPDLAAGLRPERLFDDRTIDRVLVEVAVPPGLSSRVRMPAAVGPARAGGGRVGAPAWSGPKMRWFRELARDGMTVALAVGFIVAMFFVGMSLTDMATRATAERRLARSPAGRAARAEGMAVSEPVVREAVDTPESGRRGPLDAPPRDVAPDSGTVAEQRPATVETAPAVRTAPMPTVDGFDPRGRAVAGPSRGMQIVPDDDAGSVRRNVPLMRGFDLAFEMAHGEQPFVDPSIAPGLAIDRPPLSVASDSFDRLWPLPPGRRRMAAQAGLRVEHVVAALTPAPVPSGVHAPLVSLSAVRSIRPGRPTYLVEVRVDTPVDGTDVAHPSGPEDVVVVLDHSAGPDAAPLWVAMCRGVAGAAARMAPAARLTVVVAEPRPRRVAIQASAAEIREVCGALEEELPFGSADLDAAVALATASAADTGPARLVVVAEAERAERCGGAAADALRRYRAAVARGDDETLAAASFLLVSGVSDGSDSEGLAAVPGWTLSDATTVRRRLDAAIVGRPAFVADGARLEVRFDPRAIAAYRLVGHRQSVPESLAAFGQAIGVPVTTTLHGGETVRVVYEVVPRGEAGGQVAGVAATLSYRTPDRGARTAAASGAAVGEPGAVLPAAHHCELLLAVGVGEAASRSIHAVPQRAAIERLRALSEAWQRRGDVTIVGKRLVSVLDELAAGGHPAAFD